MKYTQHKYQSSGMYNIWVGYVTKFEVDADYLQKFKVENVGGEIHNEL